MFWSLFGETGSAYEGLGADDPDLPSGDFYHWQFKKYPQMNLGELKAAIRRGRTKSGKKGGVFLNSLPFDEAFKIWGAA